MKKRGKSRGCTRKRSRILVLLAALFIMTVSGFFGKGVMQAMAEDQPAPRYDKFYTSIRLEPGDTLWTIADRYNVRPGQSREDYVRELRHMNSLTDDQIHSGHYLTVAYYRLAPVR